MLSSDDINNTLGKMILSASGWRGIFAGNGEEESKTDKISEAHCVISGAAAFVFAEFLRSRAGSGKPIILLGTDTRPTCKAIIEAMMPVLISCGCEVQYAGAAAAPEIMAWARAKNSYHERRIGFIYISASHNPIGHNGIKFGLTDGGVLAADESSKLISRFRLLMSNNDFIKKIESLIFTANLTNLQFDIGDQVRAHTEGTYQRYESLYGAWLEKKDESKAESYKAYYDFCNEVAWNGSPLIASSLKDALKKRPLGIVCDFNGSARSVSVDKDFFKSLGFNFEYINGEPGQIAHRIVPEGESLEPCRARLEEAHSRDASFLIGYVPDCDGDRGNLVIWDDNLNKARPLEAQEVFALCCLAEFSHLVWTKQITNNKEQRSKRSGLCFAAVAVNDPTSMRVDRIAEIFGISVFRAEVGEANVVSLARKLREDGCLVRILGEGSAGGNITHPSAVRDPLHTVLAAAKMFSLRSSITNEQAENSQGGLFKIWCELSGQTEKYRGDFTLADIIESLPPFVTTPAYNKDAVMRINTEDHALLKNRYQQIFIREWELKKDELKTRFGFSAWEAVAYNGTAETRNLKNFKDAGKGGLKMLFKDDSGREIAYIWMRGSATEPVFRIMADIQGADNQLERDLLEWQRKMIMEADGS